MGTLKLPDNIGVEVRDGPTHSLCSDATKNVTNANNVTSLHFSYISCENVVTFFVHLMQQKSHDMYEKCSNVTFFALILLHGLTMFRL